ncbi:alkaline phosphatase-like [Ptychodera flava]|uniref:alkaline phosphatase-like n=1 Tax=Ptychodera flava TaxID=63121 RepID=UPI00396A1E67
MARNHRNCNTMILSSLLLVFYSALLVFSLGRCQPAEDWYQQAQESIANARLLEDLNKNVANNIIIFLGDGMGVPTVTSARILKGQLAGDTGEEHLLNFEQFPHVGLAKTYNTDRQVPDSAGTATAFLCGAKTKYGVIGLDDGAIRGECDTSFGNDVESILESAQNVGKSVGIVTTTRVTHATPAASYAHSPNRSWENDADVPVGHQECKDIALQMVENTGIQVILGGGRRNFRTTSQSDPESGSSGRRRDGRDLIDEWLSSKQQYEAEYVWNSDGFSKVDPVKTDYLLGLFEHSHMNYEVDRPQDIAGEPHIAEMTKKAIEILSKNPKGFFLLVEGGRIDHAHHGNLAHKSLHDVIAFDEAVQMAKNMTSSSDTFIVVTADHSHVNTITGNPTRGNPILGKVDSQNGGDNLPYTTIIYANGPGGSDVYNSYNSEGIRPNITDVETDDPSYVNQALVPLSSETHGGEDVAIYAEGPMAHLVHGQHEQHYIFHVMQYAACIGQYTEHC